MKDGIPVKTDQGNNEVFDAYVHRRTRPPYLAHPDFPEVAKPRSSGSSGWAPS